MYCSEPSGAGVTKMVTGLKYMMHEERLREFGFFCMERRWLRGHRVAIFYYLMERYREERDRRFSKVHGVR